MTGVLVALLLAAAPAVCPAPYVLGKGFYRDPEVRQAFVAKNPCPGGPDKGLTTQCRGYEVHHIVWLSCGGTDTVDNMVWLSVKQHRALHAATACKVVCKKEKFQ